jgi:hypothetical protein
MKLTRDSVILWVGWLGGMAALATAYVGMFPPEWRENIMLYSGLVSSVCGWLKTSPLLGEKKG